jgi:SAM-dependent methyltransferase
VTTARRLLDPIRRTRWARAAARWAWSTRDAVRVRRALRRTQAFDPFDRAYGVQTRVVPSLGELWRTLRQGGVEHEPSSPDEFRRVLDGLRIRFEETVFVDYGSGAGRAVLMASEYAFKAVVGIELSPWLHARAEANVRAFPAPARRAAAVKLMCGDATTFDLPSDPLVLYFYNPFGVAPMQRVLDKIETTLAHAPRPVTIILAYCYKDPREVIERSPVFRVVTNDNAILTLRSLTPSELVTPAPARSTA